MFHRVTLALLATALLTAQPSVHAADSGKPLRALLITGGCCHNYTFQSQTLTNAVAKLARVEWKIVNEGGNGTHAELSLYDDPNWAKGFDVVVHNECFADTKSPDYISKITSAHKGGIPAVVIHCAMHTYRSAEIDDWREFLGVTSRRHDHQSNYPVKKVTEHLILNGIPNNWVSPKDELYIIEKLWPNAKALATSKSEQDGKEYPVAWINQYGKARVFGTTFGHSDETFRDPAFLSLVSRGLLWSAGRLEK